MLSVRYGLMTGAALLAAGTAQAQTGATRRLDFAVTGDVTYDDNVARANDDRAEARGLSQEDFIFSPAATADVLMPIGRQTLTLTGRVGYDFYARNERLNRERIGIDSTLGLLFGPCTGAVSAGFSRAQSDLGDLLYLVPGTPSVINTQTSANVGARASCGSLIGLRPTGSINYGRVRNSEFRRQFSDSDSTTVTLGVSYSRPLLGVLTLEGGYTRITYPTRQDLFGFNDEGVKTKFANVRFERNIGTRLYGTIEGGYSKVEAQRPGVPDFSGFTGSASLTARATDRLQISAALSRSVQASNYFASSYNINKSVSLDANYALGERVIISPGVSWQSRDPRGETGFFGPVIGSDERSSLRLGVRFNQSRRLAFGARVEHLRRTADNELYDYTSNRATLSAIVRL